jgi:tRNA_anti-like
MKKSTSSIAQVVAVLLFVGWCAARSGGSATTSTTSTGVVPPTQLAAAPTPPAPAPEKTTAIKIARDFEKNEVSAEDYYKGRCFDVTGVVEMIDAGIGSDATVHLRGGIMGVGRSRCAAVS